MYLYTKQVFSFALMIFGAVLIFFVPENTWNGLVLFMLGLGVEIIGLSLRHREKRNKE